MVIECLPGVKPGLKPKFFSSARVQPRVFVSYIFMRNRGHSMSLTHIGTCSSSFFSTSLFSSFSSVGCAAIVTKSASRLPNWSWTPSPGVITFVPSGFSDEGCFSANEGSSSSCVSSAFATASISIFSAAGASSVSFFPSAGCAGASSSSFFSSTSCTGASSSSFFSSTGCAGASSSSFVSFIGIAASSAPSFFSSADFSTFILGGESFVGEFSFEPSSSTPSFCIRSSRYCANTVPVVGHFANRFSTISSSLKLIFLCFPSKELEFVIL
mmetsp:Transcript_9463/g.27281  ORF Transcript_9463/g.27281 Transcript_9463/m.27281 type:complete len:270 (+) Transcript_9463:2369-3178(+)